MALTEDGQALEMIWKRTQTAAARNLVELRGRTLKNYEVAHELKIKARRDHSDSQRINASFRAARLS